jgi:hypothetical protein
MQTPRRSFLALVLMFVVCGACGSSNSSAKSPPSTSAPSGTTAAPALPRSQELQNYCNWAYRYYDVVGKIDYSDFKSAIPSLEDAADVAERWAASALEPVRDAQRELVFSNADFLDRIKQSAPKTNAEFAKAVDNAHAAIAKKYPNLDHDSEVVKAFDHTNCGVDNG